MNARAIAKLASQVKVAAAAAGCIPPGDIVHGPESVGIVGTGVDLLWEADALAPGVPGWQLRRTEHVSEPAQGREGMVTEILGSFPLGSGFNAARAAVLAVVRRRIDAALSQAA